MNYKNFTKDQLVSEVLKLNKELKQLKSSDRTKKNNESFKNGTKLDEIFPQIVSNSPNPIFIVNYKGKIIFYNSSCKKALGCKNEFLNKKYSVLLNKKNDIKKIDAIISEVFNSGKSFSSVELNLNSPKGKVYKSNSRFYPIKNKNKKVIACVIGSTNITKEKVIEEALRKSQETFRALTESSTDVIMRFDKKYRHIYVNPIVKKQTGIPAKKFIGKTHRELGFPEHLIKIWEGAIRKVFRTGKPNRIEFELPKKIWIDWLLVPEFSSTGKVQYVITTARDITERKKFFDQIQRLNQTLEQRVKDRTKELLQLNKELRKEIKNRTSAEKLLKEREYQYRNIFNSVQEGLLIVNKKGKIVEANPAASQIHNYPREKFIGMDIKELIYPSELEKFTKGLKKLIKDKFVVYEGNAVKSDGTAIFIEAKAIVFIYKGEKHYLISTTDVTRRKISERKLVDKEQNYRALFNFSPGGIMLEDYEGNILDANPAMCNMLGYSKNELIGMNITQLSPPKYHQKIKKNISYLMKNKRLRHTVQNIRKDGSICYLELNEAKISLSYGGEFILVIANDVTDQKLAYRKLAENEYRYRTLFDSSPSGIIITDKNDKILDVNPSLCSVLGYNYDEILGKHSQDFSLNVNDYSLEEDLDALESGKSIKRTIRSINKDGSSSYLELNKILVPLANSDEGILITCTDITKRINYEKELLKAKEEAEISNRLKSEFLAQMSHEIRSPINVILSFTSLLQQELGKCNDPDYLTYFDSIARGGKRIIKTIDMILNMSEIQTGSFETSPKKINLNDEIKGVMLEYKSLAENKNLSIEFESSVEEAIITADEYSLSQILSNLVDNAIKYTEKGGITLRLFPNEFGKYSIEVADTGIGISEKYLPDLFQPFTQEDTGYTRKFEGTGLGLALVQQYCKLNNAEISVSSKKGKGSVFRIDFK